MGGKEPFNEHSLFCKTKHFGDELHNYVHILNITELNS